ncbi:MAG: TPM domain-containing protein [Terrimicrobiaceae bacterium]
MKPHDFLQKLDDAEVVKAIKAAERKTSGEIRVFVTSRDLGADKVVDRATARFEKLGMTATRERNGVLLYFVPRAHQFAIVGDKGIHEKCGEAFWGDVASGIGAKLKEGRFTEAVVRAIEKTGEALARHFPRRPDDRNELPDAVGQD